MLWRPRFAARGAYALGSMMRTDRKRHLEDYVDTPLSSARGVAIVIGAIVSPVGVRRRWAQNRNFLVATIRV